MPVPLVRQNEVTECLGKLLGHGSVIAREYIGFGVVDIVGYDHLRIVLGKFRYHLLHYQTMWAVGLGYLLQKGSRCELVAGSGGYGCRVGYWIVADCSRYLHRSQRAYGRAEKIVFKLLSIGIECSQLRDIIPVSISQGDYGEVTAVIIYGILGDMQGDALGILPVGQV